MPTTDPRDQQLAALRERLAKLSEASLRINENLDFDTVLQRVLDSACSLTGARYGVITLLNESGQIQDIVTSGLTPEEHRRFMELPEGLRLFEHLSRITEPLRLRDFHSHTRALGLPAFRPPMATSPVLTFLAAPIRHLGESVGAFYVGEKELEFTPEDEATLVMFATQAALVIANARRHRDEQRARAALETLIDTSPVGILVFDATTGGVASVNREARRIVSDLCAPGGSAELLLETLTFRRADGREVSLAEFPLARALNAGETVRAEEIRLQAPDGRSVTTLVNATPIRAEAGAIESVVVTLQDLTPLEEQARLRADFLAMVSHELRLPLAAIRGAGSTLLDTAADLQPAEQHQFHRIIVEQADHLRALIADLLDVARIKTGTLAVTPAPAAVTRLVDAARSTFRSSGGRHRLVLDLAPDLPLVLADGRRIGQVLGNLLANAAKYAPAATAIRVTARPEDGHVALTVADEGRGIAAEQLPLVFGQFPGTAGAEPGGAEGGPGLGLAIGKGIVEAHGGRIWAASDGPGRGAQFTFTLPAVAAAPPGPTPRPGRSPARILVVDDDPQTLRSVREALAPAGYAVVVTGDPADAQRHLVEHRPDLVLLDLVLPAADGIEVLQDFHRLAAVPIIILSGYGREEVLAHAFERGAADYLVKPFAPTELVARVQAALRRPGAPDPAEPATPYVRGPLTLDYAHRRVTVAGRPVPLTPTEYRLLCGLAVDAGRVVSHDRLGRRVWGPGTFGDLRVALRTHVRRLRRKLGDAAARPTYLFAEPRVGYRLAAAEAEDEAAGTP